QMKLRIETISKKNLKSAHKIYNYYITNSYANFEEKKITFKDFHKNYENIMNKKLPYLVALYDEKVVGIAYLNHFREKSGYRFTFENTIYIHNLYIRQGIGFKLLKALIDISKKNKKIKLLVAVIGSIDSQSSIKIHQKLGFRKVGKLTKVGFKKNKWIDSIFLQKKVWKK
ncbi:MAG: N-acetyltransferase family protein, partial [Alphaproteobacteria bacterium]